MRIFTEQPLKEFVLEHPEAKTALQEWATVVKNSQWTNFSEMKVDFPGVTSKGNQLYTFEIPGDHCEIVVAVRFTLQLINIKKLIHN